MAATVAAGGNTMQRVEIPADKAIELAEIMLAVFCEVQNIVQRPRTCTEEMLAQNLSPHNIAAIHLHTALEALSEVITLPAKDRDATSISSESVLLMLALPLRHLASFIVRAKRARETEVPLGADDAYNTLLVSALVITTLLSSTATFPLPHESTAVGAFADPRDTIFERLAKIQQLFGDPDADHAALHDEYHRLWKELCDGGMSDDDIATKLLTEYQI